jgi:hypothetical protein
MKNTGRLIKNAGFSTEKRVAPIDGFMKLKSMHIP